MTRIGKLENGVIVNVVTTDAVVPAGWMIVPDYVGPGHTWDGATYTPPAPVRRKVLTAFEWVETWTADEWRSLKTAAAGGTAVAKRLDQLLDAIRLTGSFNLESATAVTFYGFLESNGYIDAARRAGLTQGVL